VPLGKVTGVRSVRFDDGMAGMRLTKIITQTKSPTLEDKQ
jgi:hypothetical protein